MTFYQRVISIKPLLSQILTYLELETLLQLSTKTLNSIKSYNHHVVKDSVLNLNVGLISEQNLRHLDFILDFARYQKIKLTFDENTSVMKTFIFIEM